MHGQRYDHTAEAQRDRRQDGREMADDPARAKKRDNRQYKVSSDFKRRYCIVLDICGLVCDCPDQQGRGGIIPARSRGG